ncbi:unnamed protein product [Effrenium voratum]|nr:unnamed protein product [Effrenium voratum]
MPSGQEMLGTVRYAKARPELIRTWFDSFQLKKNVGHRPSSFAEKAGRGPSARPVYSEHFANRTRSLVRELRSGWPFSGEQNGVFSWACYSHATSLDQSFEHMATTDGTTLAKATSQFLQRWSGPPRLDVTSASVAALAAVQQLDVWGQICWVSAFDSLDSLQWLFIRQRFGAGFFETVGSEFASLSIAVAQVFCCCRGQQVAGGLEVKVCCYLMILNMFNFFAGEGRGVAGPDVRAGLVQACPEGAFLRLMGDPRKVFFEAQQAIQSNLGHAASTTTAGLAQQVFDFELPVIPPGAKTTIIPVAFPINSLPEKAQERTVQELKILAVFGLAVGFWVLPYVLINRGACCRCFQRWLSRHMRCYFCTGLIFVLCAVAYMIASQPDVNANDIFFCFVNILEMLSDKLMDVLTQLSMVLGIVLVWFLRKKIVSLLGYDQQLVRAELKDMLNLFEMTRFAPIEVTLWKAEGLPIGFSSRTLYVRMILGYNEAQHSRPHDNCTNSVVLREKFTLNYDPEDNTQEMSIIIKQQELVGNAVSQLAPMAGAIVGSVGGLVTPLGPAAGAGLGVVTGVGAANSLGLEIARVDLSSAMINKYREKSQAVEVTNRSLIGTARPYSTESFVEVPLVPQGKLWLCIADLPEP